MGCAVYIWELVIFTLVFHIVAINHYKSIKSIDNNRCKKIIDVKSKKNYKLPYCYISEDKRVCRYCDYNDYKVKDKLNLVTSQAEKRFVNTAVAQIITVFAEKRWHWYNIDMMLWCHINVLSMLYLCRIFTENSTYKAVPKINNSTS